MSSSISTASDFLYSNSSEQQRRLSLHNVEHSASSPTNTTTLLPSIHAFRHVTHTLPKHPSPLHHSPDLMNTTHQERRESLPSIQHLTAEPLAQPFPPPEQQQQQAVHDTSIRRHSVHTTKISLVNGDINQRRNSMTPYSRTPELRASHKLAERRRRKEMKELFDDLLNVLPIEKGAKTSKWEILSKAVDYIGNLRQREAMFAREKDLLLKEKAALKRHE